MVLIITLRSTTYTIINNMYEGVSTQPSLQYAAAIVSHPPNLKCLNYMSDYTYSAQRTRACMYAHALCF